MDEQTDGKLRFISTTHRAAFEQRQRYEWQMLITTLTFYVLTVTAIYAGNFHIPKSNCAVTAVFSFALVLLAFISCGFLMDIQTANLKNKRVAEAAERAIVLACANQEVIDALPLPRDRCEKYWNWSFRWQCAIIISFALVSALLIWQAPALP